MRRKLGHYINDAESASAKAKQSADYGNLVSIKRHLDDWIDEAIDAGLYSGDPQAMTLLQKARSIRRDYSLRFESQKGDMGAGKVIEKMLRDDVTNVQAVNMIFGMGAIGMKDTSVQIVRKMRLALGKDSPDFNLVKETAFMRMIYGPKAAGRETLSYGGIKTRLGEMLDGRGTELTLELFSPEEITKLRAFREEIKRLIPPARATNPSKTGYEVARALEDVAGKLFFAFGFATGNPAVAMAAAGGGQAARAITQSGAAKKAIVG